MGQGSWNALGRNTAGALAERVPRPSPAAPSPGVKSPLRYPGGKSRAVKAIVALMPDNLTRLASPFLGGGSLEIALANKGVRVHGYDAFKPLVLFWQAALGAPGRLADRVKEFYPLPKARFYDIQQSMREGRISDADMPALFFVMNRSSYSGTTLSGGMSPGHPRFTPSAIERLRGFAMGGWLSVEMEDFETSLARHQGDFIYADPPYANGGALYGQRGDYHIDFDHKRLASILTKREGWILSYNDCDLIRDLYAGFPILPCAWAYGMNGDKKSNEIIILSKDSKGIRTHGSPSREWTRL